MGSTQRMYDAQVMKEDTNSAPWLRRTSAALTALATLFWALGALSTLGFLTIAFYPNWLQRPGGVADYVYVAISLLIAGFVSFSTTRWQWSRMAHARAGDHGRLVVLLIMCMLYVQPRVPFVTGG